MSWVKFDDGYPSHRKVRRLSDAAYRLDSSGILWSARHLTDGFIPEDDLELVADLKPAAKGKHQRAVSELIEAGRWEVTSGGWRIHDYHDYNPTSDDVRESRARELERKKRYREGLHQRAKGTGK